MNNSHIQQEVAEKIKEIYQWAIENHSSKGIKITKEEIPSLKIGKAKDLDAYFIDIYPNEVFTLPPNEIVFQIIVKIGASKFYLNLKNNDEEMTWEDKSNIKDVINETLIKKSDHIGI